MEEVTLQAIFGYLDGIISLTVTVTVIWFLWRRYVYTVDKQREDMLEFIEYLQSQISWHREHFLTKPVSSQANMERVNGKVKEEWDSLPEWVVQYDNTEPSEYDTEPIDTGF